MRKLLCKIFGHPGMGRDDIFFAAACHNRSVYEDKQNGLVEGETVFYGSVTQICPRCGFRLNLTEVMKMVSK
jgi:hypothetical protein